MERFNIRVYGIIVNHQQEILLSKESRFGREFTKFPGGGLEWGEGTKDTLQRELFEETGLKFEIEELIYVNDFFQQSAFRKTDQLFSFYFRATRKEYPVDVASTNGAQSDGEVFQWKSLLEVKECDLTFPIDKLVLEQVKLLF